MIVQPVQRIQHTGIQFRMHRDAVTVMAQQAVVILILGARRQQGIGRHPVIPRTQHRLAAMERDQRITDRIQQVTQAPRAKTGIRRRDQIPRGIRQSPVQIEDHRASHEYPPRNVSKTKVTAPGLSSAPPPD